MGDFGIFAESARRQSAAIGGDQGAAALLNRVVGGAANYIKGPRAQGSEHCVLVLVAVVTRGENGLLEQKEAD